MANFLNTLQSGPVLLALIPLVLTIAVLVYEQLAGVEPGAKTPQQGSL
jgi:membrane-anchored glycerophosphoryl diester phosphodiesterase (GDPDase)